MAKAWRLISRLALPLILVSAAFAVGLFRQADFLLFDAFSLVRLATANPSSTGLPVVVAIDGQALRAQGRWPWPRAKLARLLGLLRAGEPAVIGVDILFAEAEPGDDALTEAIRRGRVVLAERLDLRRTGGKLSVGQPEPPLQRLRATALGVGFVDFFPDADGVARRMPISQAVDGEVHYSMAAAMARAGGREPRGAPSAAPALSLLVRPADWPTIPAGEVLSGGAPPSLWRGRPVLVGLTAPGVVTDSFPVPVRALGSIPGVYLHGYAYATLTAWGAVRGVPWPIAGLLSVLPAVPLLARRRAGRPWRVARVFALLTALVLLGSLLLFLLRWWWGPSLALAALAMSTAVRLIGQAAADQQRERRLRHAFARFVSPHALREILRGPEPVLGGERREITALFADLRGFSAWAEGRPPERVAVELNRHLDLMSQAILAAGGMVDKFMGDAVMGVFGAPLAAADHRQRALSAARAIREALQEPGLLPVGVGLASGAALVGNIGGNARLAYTAIGDPVNLAARLEEMAGPGEILADAGCFPGAGPSAGWEGLGETRIRGRAAPAMVYRSVIGITDAAPA